MTNRARPLIGVNMHLVHEIPEHHQRTQDAAEWLVIERRYIECIRAVGGDPVLLPPGGDKQNAPTILGLLDGLVMIGGADYDPIRQGCHRTVWNRQIIPAEQETFDRMLLRTAYDKRLPLLAIGAGMQLLNVFCGGSLSYQIQEDFHSAISHIEPNRQPVRHSLNITPGSFVEKALGTSDVGVTSMHHQAILEVAQDFDVTAICPDGIIEAIESSNPSWFAIGVQFHPELAIADEVERMVFDAWVGRVSRTINRERTTARIA